MIPFRIRPDLVATQQHANGTPCWNVKDPVTLKYFTFSPVEYGLLKMLDGTVKDFTELQQRFEREFAPERTSTEKIRSFVSDLYHNGLLISEIAGESERWLRRSAGRRRLWWNPANLLAVRFPGVDLDAGLAVVLQRCRWLFSPWWLAACLAVMVYAALLVSTRWHQLQHRLPEIESFVSAQNLIWLAAALSVTKLLHELGHALTCKFFGGECHETGIILLVFTPCLYCDVSDSWVLSNRWHRMAIAAAGIFVDLLLASLATLGWVWSKPGFVSAFLLNVMVVCGIGTVVLNGNPLLRYDGYYILSDLLNVPNLWQRSRQSVWRVIRQLGLGIPPRVGERGTPQLLLYGAASMVYRTFVLCAIVLMMYRLLAPAGWRAVADLIAGGVGLGVVASTLSGMVGFVRSDAPREMRWPRVGGALLVVAALLCVLFFVPLPTRVVGSAVCQYADVERIYVTRTGTLVDALPLGESVQENQVLAQLEDSYVSREVVRLENAVRRQQARVTNLRTLHFDDDRSGEQIPAAIELLRDLKNQLAEKRKDLASLEMRTRRVGVILAPPPRLRRLDHEDELAAWSGIPMDDRNRECTLQRGTLYCLVGDPARFEAIVVVEQDDIGRVAVGSHVQLDVNSGAANLIRGEVRQISRQDLQIVPPELAADREVATRRDEGGTARPMSTSYQVRVMLDNTPGSARLQSFRGRAFIRATPETIVARLRRWIRRNFHV